MKHTLKVNLLLSLMFLLSQLLGIFVVYSTMNIKIIEGVPEVTYAETVMGPRPPLYGLESFLYVVTGVLIGTGILLLIIRFRKINWWRALFFFVVFIAISLSLGVFIRAEAAFLIALILAVWKMFLPNAIIHNFTELLMYAGIAVLFVPLFNVLWIVILLLVISVYDFVAVFKTKHMVKMAKPLMKTEAFAGFMFHYSKKDGIRVKTTRIRPKGRSASSRHTGQAILGGGDIALPLIFTGVALDSLIRISGFNIPMAFMKTLIISVILVTSLFLLLLKGEQGKFYPAMPFLTAGCLIGYAIAILV